MPLLIDFEYFKPQSISEAVKLLSRHKKAAILAGGTDIINEIKVGMTEPKALIDIKGLKSLKKIQFKDGKLLIGSLATFSDIIASRQIKKRFPVLIEIAEKVGSVGVRNRATMVGNICSAVPCMDSGPILTAFDAVIIVKTLKGNRRIKIADWFKGVRKTSLKKAELVTGIEIPMPKKKHAGCYVKLGRYAGEDLAQASVLVLALTGKSYRVAFGSVGPVPIRAHDIEKLFDGKVPDENLINQAREMIPSIISPITDIRATKEYRLMMCQVMFERAINAAYSRLIGKGPDYGADLI
jgi:CO/xanthine dehydrogenase FAD-binding subunit